MLTDPHQSFSNITSTRPSGSVVTAPLTAFDPVYPYICAEYDTDEAG